MAECHPVAFRWVMEAKRRGATIIHVDPRFTRTSALEYRGDPMNGFRFEYESDSWQYEGFRINRAGRQADSDEAGEADAQQSASQSGEREEQAPDGPPFRPARALPARGGAATARRDPPGSALRLPDRPPALRALHPRDGRARHRLPARQVPRNCRRPGPQLRPRPHRRLLLRRRLDPAHQGRADDRLRRAAPVAARQHRPAWTPCACPTPAGAAARRWTRCCPRRRGWRCCSTSSSSGKQQQHTLKSQVAVDELTGEVADVAESVRGPTHDLTLLPAEMEGANQHRVPPPRRRAVRRVPRPRGPIMPQTWARGASGKCGGAVAGGGPSQRAQAPEPRVERYSLPKRRSLGGQRCAVHRCNLERSRPLPCVSSPDRPPHCGKPTIRSGACAGGGGKCSPRWPDQLRSGRGR